MEYTSEIILASASPRRSELLARMGIPFVVMATDVDETVDQESPEAALLLARRKARAAGELLRGQGRGGVVLAADTIVWCEWHIWGKPTDADDAERILERIAGRWHEVYTGVCALDVATGREGSLLERTRVRMAPMSPAEIRAYVATGEPMDKAGAYAIQGEGSMFVEAIEGSPSNVMGLPMAQCRALLARFLQEKPPFAHPVQPMKP
jgi:septum formation protein